MTIMVDSEIFKFSLECLKESFSAIDSGENGLTVLDYGCGPKSSIVKDCQTIP